MKRTILLITGLFTLWACSEEVYQDIDKQNSGNVENENSTNDGSGGNTPFTVSPEINSPYEDTNYGNSVNYVVRNDSPYVFEITPYIGLAYYDGMDDGLYHNPNLATPVDLTVPGAYPNLYLNNGKEYLNLIQGQTIEYLPLSGYTNISSSNHCPVQAGQAFDVLTGGATTAEADLLENAGKVYYFDVVVRAAPGGPIITSATIKQIFNGPSNTPPFDFADWKYLGFIAPTPYVEMFYSNIYSQEIASGNYFSVPGAAEDRYNFSVGSNNHAIRYYTISGAVMIGIQ